MGIDHKYNFNIEVNKLVEIILGFLEFILILSNNIFKSISFI